ncbi:MAG: permease prefix domain 1-containing protein [Clostridiales bacterium]|nr:permease prefix domain 1-containing protein [Clostridiales bacterium]
MNDSIRQYLELAFAAAPQVKSVLELKEELYLNLSDKYQDLLDEGESPERAYATVISGLGNVNELIAGVLPPAQYQFEAAQQEDGRKKMMGALSRMLWLGILCLYFSVSFAFNNWYISWVIFLLGIALQQLLRMGTENLLSNVKLRPTLTDQERKLKNSFHSLMWSVVILLYFVLSFVFHIWAWSWILFLAGALGSAVIDTLFLIKRT